MKLCRPTSAFYLFFLAACLSGQLHAEAARPKASVQAVQGMDIGRYVGTWYEIARFPNRFQKKCAGDVTANYTPLTDGTLRVLNKCRLADGKYEQALAVARKADPDLPNTILKVRFAPAWLSWLPLVWADYWVVALDTEYAYALVGTPDHDYLWVLSRTPDMDAAIYAGLLKQAEAQGYDISRLQKTVQGQPAARS